MFLKIYNRLFRSGFFKKKEDDLLGSLEEFKKLDQKIIKCYGQFLDSNDWFSCGAQRVLWFAQWHQDTRSGAVFSDAPAKAALSEPDGYVEKLSDSDGLERIVKVTECSEIISEYFKQNKIFFNVEFSEFYSIGMALERFISSGKIFKSVSLQGFDFDSTNCKKVFDEYISFLEKTEDSRISNPSEKEKKIIDRIILDKYPGFEFSGYSRINYIKLIQGNIRQREVWIDRLVLGTIFVGALSTAAIWARGRGKS